MLSELPGTLISLTRVSKNCDTYCCYLLLLLKKGQGGMLTEEKCINLRSDDPCVIDSDTKFHFCVVCGLASNVFLTVMMTVIYNWSMLSNQVNCKSQNYWISV